MPGKRGPKSPLTDEHKAAMAEGRAASRTVKAYLEAVGEAGRRASQGISDDDIRARLSAIADDLERTDALTRLKLVQERIDLESELEHRSSAPDIDVLEREFIEVAGPYADRQGVSYRAWREVGVPANVLARAGIARR